MKLHFSDVCTCHLYQWYVLQFFFVKLASLSLVFFQSLFFFPFGASISVQSCIYHFSTLNHISARINWVIVKILSWFQDSVSSFLNLQIVVSSGISFAFVIHRNFWKLFLSLIWSSASGSDNQYNHCKNCIFINLTTSVLGLHTHHSAIFYFVLFSHLLMSKGLLYLAYLKIFLFLLFIIHSESNLKMFVD